MRSLIAALPLLSLAACGGASGPLSIGSVAPPAATSTTPTSTSTPTPGNPGTGGTGTVPTPTPTPTPAQQHFLDVAASRSWDAIGSFHTLGIGETGVDSTSGPQLYSGNASLVRTPSGQVTYDPRDGIFSISFVDTKAGLNQATRFQDPAHRTAFGGAATPSWGVPVDSPSNAAAMPSFNFLEAVGPTASSSPLRIDLVTFFYQRPGAASANGTGDSKSALYVSLAGYVRNAFTPTSVQSVYQADSESIFERGAMVFGDQTLRSQIPALGSGTYRGDMIATMVGNTSIDSNTANPTYFQWIVGTSNIAFDFGRSTMSMLLTGTVTSANMEGYKQVANSRLGIPAGSTFTAAGSGRIDLVGTGGFTGQFDSASFSPTNGGTVPIYNRVNPANQVAGANSIDGTFFGPNAVNAGGNFRIVGGVPDQRVDILGAFTGAKQ